MSQISIIQAPRSAAAGMRIRLSDPTNMRAMWGDTNPMNPMTPVKLTMPAATRDMMRRQIMRTLSTFIPSDLAYASPELRALSVLVMRKSAKNPSMETTARIGICSQVVIPMLPTVQVYTLAAEFGSALSIIYDWNALKMYMMAIPTRIIIAGEGFFQRESATMNNAGTNAKMNAFNTRP